VSDSFFADVSSWQPPVDSTYPFPVLSFRIDWGGGIDDNAAKNWAYVRDHDRMRCGIGYVVFKAGQADAIFNRVKGFFGGKAPAKLVVMIDMESGGEFAGGGDHSAGANHLAALFAGWLGDPARVIGYANRFDWQQCWPNPPAWLKRITAAYSTLDPGTFGWQYYGGVATNPSPTGYPRSCPPFGSNVDMNVIHRSLSDVLAAFGFVTPPKEFTMTPAEAASIKAMIDARADLAETKIRAIVREEIHHQTVWLTQLDGEDPKRMTTGHPIEAVVRAALAKPVAP
jgi:hypothetical protein